MTIRGRGVPVAAPSSDPHGSPGATQSTPPHRLTLYIADDGVITCDLTSRTAGRSTGRLDVNTPLPPTGWADWQLTVDRVVLHAEH